MKKSFFVSAFDTMLIAVPVFPALPVLPIL